MIQYPQKLIFLVFILLGAACKEISFREPQPVNKKALSGIPKKLQGRYLLIDENGVDSDTLLVTSIGYGIGNNVKHEVHLSDTLILKHFRGYYFLNIKQEQEWYLRVLQKDTNGNLLYMTMENENNNFNDYLKNLSLQVKIDSLKSNDRTLYQINPTPKELISLIKNNMFKKITLKKIN